MWPHHNIACCEQQQPPRKHICCFCHSCFIFFELLDHVYERHLQSSVDQHLIDASVDTQLTLNWHLCWQSVKCRLTRMNWLKIWSTLNWLLTETSMDCRLSVNWSTDQVSIEGIDWHSIMDAFKTHDPIYLHVSTGLEHAFGY